MRCSKLKMKNEIVCRMSWEAKKSLNEYEDQAKVPPLLIVIYYGLYYYFISYFYFINSLNTFLLIIKFIKKHKKILNFIFYFAYCHLWLWFYSF